MGHHILKDRLNNKDQLSICRFNQKQGSPFARTRIRAGYDAYKDKNGLTQFGTVLFEKTNTIVLGGSLFTLSKVFNAKPKNEVDTLNNIMDIANTGPSIQSDKDTYVCLFGVGTGGSGMSLSDVKDVKVYEREIFDMVPFRQTADELTSEEAAKYWFKKKVDIGGVTKTAYYLKKFENEPEVHVLWRDAEGDEDGSEVGPNVHETSAANAIPIETFVEATLKITKKDIREYFDDDGNIEITRINSIGLFTGVLGTLDDGTHDYKQVKLFSKLNIFNEPLALAKDLTISYRIYAS